MSDADKSAPRPRYKRSARNYLLDKEFQLKYTGFLVGIALALCIVLGALLWKASDEVLDQTRDTVAQGHEAVRQGQLTVEQGQATVKQGQATVDRGKEVIKLSNDLNKLVASTMETCYPGDEGLLESYKASTADDDKKLQKEQARLESDKKSLEADTLRFQEQNRQLAERTKQLEAESARAERRQTQLRIVLGVILFALVAAIGVAGIVFTHKIAGPIFKMKRLFRQIGEGKLVLREKLRKGDELQHFFEAFEKMVDDLRDKQQREIVELEEVIDKLQASGNADESALAALRSLRTEMQDHLKA